jgi:2-isopropylmalate synthase
MPDRVRIFDTTLRDGEQSPGIVLNDEEKVAIAQQLAKLGVDVIEAGFPASSPADADAVAKVATAVRGPVVAALARAVPDDVDRAWEAVGGAEHPRIHVFIATSPIHMEHQLCMSPEQVMEAAKENVVRARSYCDDVEFSPMDATRSDADFMIAVCQAAVEAGATTINIPDTVGYATPEEFGALIRRVVDEVAAGRDDVVISAHCHDDLGMAVANSLAAVENGARQIEGTINGIGERAGNTAIEEIAMALKVRADHYGVDVGIDTKEIYATSRLVAELTECPVQYNKAVVGRNAFSHEAGIHQHGVLRNPSTYEIMDPTAVGQQGSRIVLGKHSGRAAFGHMLGKMRIQLEGDDFEEAFARFKDVASRRGRLDEGEMRAVAYDATVAERTARMIAVRAAGRVGEVAPSGVSPAAAGRNGSAEADSVVAACFDAAREAFGVQASLLGYDVRSADGEEVSEVRVIVRVGTSEVAGSGVSDDLVTAAAKALTAAFGGVATDAVASGAN